MRHPFRRLSTLLAFTALSAHGGAPPPVATVQWDEDPPELLASDAMIFGEDRDFTVAYWVRMQGETSFYPALLSNKDWASGRLVDMTTINSAGWTLSSGAHPGWAFTVQPNGAWAWNIGTGEHRLDYLPTPERQGISDGTWHLLTFSVIRARQEARLYFDGVNVAIYAINGFRSLHADLPTRIGQDGQGRQTETLGLRRIESRASVWDRALTDEQVFALYREQFPDARPPASPERVEALKVMAWNIWHGGRHNGLHTGVRQTADIIRSSGADIVCMQETYGSGPLIADRLGYYFYLRSSNLSVMSRYPLGESIDLYQPFRLGGVQVHLNDEQMLNVFSLWIHYLPAWGRDARAEGATPEALVAGEWETRAREITDILATLEPYIERADETPLIVAGDFNSPSHKDWTPETTDWHQGLVVPWPVSKAMSKHGFVDAYRSVHPDPRSMTAHDQWQGGAERTTWRIDYVYTLGRSLQPEATAMWNRPSARSPALAAEEQAAMWNDHTSAWPSDHPAVVTTLRVTP